MGEISDMIFSPEALVAYISQVMTLLPGDVVLTGTPAGVGPLAIGDRVRVEIEGIGSLENPVQARPVPAQLLSMDSMDSGESMESMESQSW